MYEIEIKLDGRVVATVKWQPMGDHNTEIKGTWGEVSCYCKSLSDAIIVAQKKIGGFE